MRKRKLVKLKRKKVRSSVSKKTISIDFGSSCHVKTQTVDSLFFKNQQISG